MPPPSCANRVTKLAPKPKPTIWNGAVSGLVIPPKATNITEPPSRESATTRKPETAPPRRLAWIASFSDRRAALAVRLFDWIEMYIPVHPASAEHPAPTRKETAVDTPSDGELSTAAITAPTTMQPTNASAMIVPYW